MPWDSNNFWSIMQLIYIIYISPHHTQIPLELLILCRFNNSNKFTARCCSPRRGYSHGTFWLIVTNTMRDLVLWLGQYGQAVIFPGNTFWYNAYWYNYKFFSWVWVFLSFSSDLNSPWPMVSVLEGLLNGDWTRYGAPVRYFSCFLG